VKERLKISSNWLLGMLLALCLLGSALSAHRQVQWLFHQGDNSYPESAVVQVGLWAEQTGRLYPAIAVAPFTPAPYGPLLYLSVAAVARLSSSDYAGVVVLLRAIMFSVLLGLCLVVYLCSRRTQTRALFALIAATLLLAQSQFFPWSVTVRADVPAILFSVLALLFVLKDDSATTAFAVAAGASVAFALLFKHTFVAAPAAICVWLLWRRDYIRLVTVLVTAFVTVGGLIGWLMARGEPVLRELFILAHPPMSLRSEVGLIKDSFRTDPGQWAVLALALIGLRAAQRKREPGPVLVALYFVLALAVALLTLMQPGGDLNYLLEPMVAGVLLVPLGLSELVDNWLATPNVVRAFVLLMLGALLITGVDRWREIPPPRSTSAFASLFNHNRVLTTSPYLAVHSREPQVLDPYLNTILEATGRWSPDALLRAIRNEDYDYIVMYLKDGTVTAYRGYPFFSNSIQHEIKAHYEPFCAFEGDVSVLIPRGQASNQTRERQAIAAAGCVPAGPVSADQGRAH
jgi:hypothetical protein